MRLFACQPLRRHTPRWAIAAPSGLFRLTSNRYSGFKRRFVPTVRLVPSPQIAFHGGRGPPERRRRPELQALSNSLQLTSW